MDEKHIGEPCPKRVYGRDEDGKLLRGVRCNRPIQFRIEDKWFQETYYRCPFHAGRDKSHRTTVHAIDLISGECLSCRDSVNVGTCDFSQRKTRRVG